jgi:hypothetical protein
MLPFTTYNIPETAIKETPQPENWLWIVLNQPITPDQEELLQKICQALNADFAKDIFILVCSPSQSISIAELDAKKIKLILSFGILPQSLGIWVDLVAPGIRFLEAYCFILSVPLDELLNHPGSKKQLWSSMQSFIKLNENH